MAIVTIFSGSYCQAEEVAAKVAEQAGLERIENQLLTETTVKYQIKQEKLVRALTGPTPILNKFSREREKNVAYLRHTLAELVQQNKVLYHGFASLLLPRRITHILRVCLIGNHHFRVSNAEQTEKISQKEAEKKIYDDDQRLFDWSHFIAGKNPFDKEDFDILLPMHETSVEQAVKIILDNLSKPALANTPEALQTVRDNILAAEVTVSLVREGHEVEVICQSGDITVLNNKYQLRLEQYEKQLKSLAEQITGVQNVTIKVGPRYTQPSINPLGDLELPPRLLLVDDEKDFVHTLSERLLTRDLHTAIVYDGEEALSYVESDEPEVMVLDLKMPGIDGLEVLRRVKSTHPLVEVIILTGHGSDRERELAEQLGAFAYLQKPANIDLLAQTMREAYQKVKLNKQLADEK